MDVRQRLSPEPITAGWAQGDHLRGGLAVLTTSPVFKGIGDVLEKKLHGFGVYRFKQIAAWTPQTLDVFSEQLDFKGRIEREEWVRQAE